MLNVIEKMQDKTILVIRHGKTSWNKMGFLSYTDVPLKDSEKKHVEILAKKLKEKMNSTDGIIYTSPLRRCKETALLLSRYLGLPIEERDELKELNFGIFEGLSIKEAKQKYPDIFEKREKGKWNFRIPKGESYRDAYLRLRKIFREIKTIKKKYVIVVTHATIMKLFLIHFSKFDVNEVQKFLFKPLSVLEIKLSRKSVKICLDGNRIY